VERQASRTGGRKWRSGLQEFPDRVHAYYRRGTVYVHSKTKVFDDVWAHTGSANIK
jgi:phosphatidylserine/phosphatidylglycerophosphate/cardiolipin synthase-like enzyme